MTIDEIRREERGQAERYLQNWVWSNPGKRLIDELAALFCQARAAGMRDAARAMRAAGLDTWPFRFEQEAAALEAAANLGSPAPVWRGRGSPP